MKEHHIEQLKTIMPKPAPCPNCGVMINPDNPPVRLLVSGDGDVFCRRECYESHSFPHETIKGEKA